MADGPWQNFNQQQPSTPTQAPWAGFGDQQGARAATPANADTPQYQNQYRGTPEDIELAQFALEPDVHQALRAADEPPTLEGDGRTWLDNAVGLLDNSMNTLTLGGWPLARGAMMSLFGPAPMSENTAAVFQNMDAARADAPLLTAVGESAGAMIPMLATGGAAALPNAVSRGVVPTVMEAGRVGTYGGAGAAAFGFNNEFGRTGDLDAAADAAWDYAAVGGGLGATIPLAAAVVPAIARGAANLNPLARSEPARFSEEALTELASVNRRLRDDAYQLIDNSSTRIAPDEIVDVLATVRTSIDDALMRETGAEALLDDWIARLANRNEGVPIGTIESWRQELNQEINRLWRSNDAVAAQRYEAIRNAFDERISELLPNQEARDLHRFQMQIDALQNAATRATDRSEMSNGALTFERAMQRELLRIKNGREWDSFTQAQQDLINAAIRDSGALSGLDSAMTRLLGSGLQRTLSNLAGTGAAAATGNIAFLAPQAISGIARGSQTAVTRRNLAELADSLGPTSDIPLLALTRSQLPFAPAMTIPTLGAGHYVTGGTF